MSVKVIGAGFPLIARAIAAMSRDTVLVGIPADSPPRRNPADPPNAVIGYVMENGAPDINVPARPFLGPGIQDARAGAIKALQQGAAQALKDVAALKTTASNGGAVRQALESVGQMAEDAVKARIDRGGFVPLAQSTIKARRARGNTSTAPLLDTEQLYHAITHRVQPKAGR